MLGGIGNLRGALLGGVVLGLIENWGAIFFGSQWKDVIAFVVLVRRAACSGRPASSVNPCRRHAHERDE